MRISVFAIGQAKSGPEAELRDDYWTRIERLGRTIGITAARLEAFPESKRRTTAERKAEEAKRLLDATGVRATTVVLSERGRQMPSRKFAERLRREMETGSSDLCFLIGGPDGHDEATEKAAGLLLSLGDMTWPHRLVQAMLCEQIYRAVSILANHPYHRE